MAATDPNKTQRPEALEHDLNRHFPELLKFESTAEMAASALWAEIRDEAERVLNAVVGEHLSGIQAETRPVGSVSDADDGETEETPSLPFGFPPSVMVSDRKAETRPVGSVSDADDNEIPVVETEETPSLPFGFPPSVASAGSGNVIRALAWNIERGNVFEGIVDALKHHEGLKDKDVLLLTELDHGMARSGNRFVAQEIARSLGMNYAFAPVYIALQKGSGVESEMAGENTLSIHGLAMFSKWPMRNIHAVPLPNGKDKMWGKEKRLGQLRALIADVAHPAGTFRAVTVHLDAHCSRAHRKLQMRIILDHLDTLEPLPTLIGGDWNTTTFNSQSSTRAIMGYWRRVFMGPKNVARNHLPHPERFFEKPLFDMIEKRGYDFRSLNQVGEGTLHYHVESIEKNTNLRDWVPEWCFPFIFWAANRVGGSVSGRLDWFAGKGILPAGKNAAKTIGHLTDATGTPLSDHDAISLDFTLAKS